MVSTPSSIQRSCGKSQLPTTHGCRDLDHAEVHHGLALPQRSQKLDVQFNHLAWPFPVGSFVRSYFSADNSEKESKSSDTLAVFALRPLMRREALIQDLADPTIFPPQTKNRLRLKDSEHRPSCQLYVEEDHSKKDEPSIFHLIALCGLELCTKSTCPETSKKIQQAPQTKDLKTDIESQANDSQLKFRLKPEFQNSAKQEDISSLPELLCYRLRFTESHSLPSIAEQLADLSLVDIIQKFGDIEIDPREILPKR